MDVRTRNARSVALCARIIVPVVLVIACSCLAQRALARSQRALRLGGASAQRALQFDPFTLRTREAARPSRVIPAAAAAQPTAAAQEGGGEQIEIQATEYSYPRPRIPHRPATRSPVRPPRS